MTKWVFYSWQSDLPNRTNRGFIEEALERAIKDLRRGVTLDPVLDRDTAGVAGAPNIAQTILEKIDRAAVLVADVTITNRGRRPAPNPNVLFETGYALATLGDGRLISVFNTAYGSVEELPFDLRFRRTLTYELGEDGRDKAEVREQLRGTLRRALELAVPLGGDPLHQQVLPSPTLSAVDGSQMRFSIPTLDLSEEERFWLRLMYDELCSGSRTPPHVLRRLHRGSLGSDFDPSAIDPRLLSHSKSSSPERYDITLLGIYHVDPDSEWIWKCHLLLSYIKQLIDDNPNVNQLSVLAMAKMLSLTPLEVSLLLTVAPGSRYSSAGGNRSAQHYMTEYTHIQVGGQKVFRFYESYRDIGEELRRSMARQRN